MGNDAAGVIDKGNQKRFSPFTVRLFKRGAMHGIGLPEFVGVLHRKGLAQPLRLRNIK